MGLYGGPHPVSVHSTARMICPSLALLARNDTSEVMTYPKVDYNDNMVDMSDYDEEGWEEKERRRWIISKTAIIIFLVIVFFSCLLASLPLI
jgi:hypothetical protein